MKISLGRGTVLLSVAFALVAAGLFLFSPHWQRHDVKPNRNITHRAKPDANEALRPSIHRIDSGLQLTSQLVEKMGLTTSIAMAAVDAIPLPSFQGVLALDNDRLSRVHSRFNGEVVELGQSTDGSDPPIRVGERVQRGDLLAVIWSTDLGQKKSELVNALAKLRTEEYLRDRLKKLFEEKAGAGRPYREAERDVQIRLVEIAAMERTLRTWRVTDQEIAEIHAEAERLIKADELAETRMSAVDLKNWARVEVRAPRSGVILEKNVAIGDIIENSTNLFMIGDLSQLAVWAHVYEEDLPLLESLPRPIRWTVTVPSRAEESFTGTLEKVGAVIDPAQHTALVTGHVQNELANLKIGQFVTVTVLLPPPQDELEVPATAVVEDGRESVVFMQPDSSDSRFVRRPVRVVRRFRDTVYIKATDQGIKPGERIVTSGALLLQNSMNQLPIVSKSLDKLNVDATAEAPRG